MRNLRFAFILSVTAMFGCTEPKTATSIQSGIIYCSESSPSSFNPQLDTSSTTVDASAHQLYDRLLEIDPATGKPIPGLASSWRVSRDGLTYSFQLRPNITFHTTDYFVPTRTLNVDDVIFSFKRWSDPNHPYHSVNGGRYPYFDSLNLRENIIQIEEVNHLRFTIRLKQPDASFITHLATDFSVILSAEYADTLLQLGEPELIDHYPIGTGPYKLAYYRKNQYIRYTPHLQYWSVQAHDGPLIFDITPQSSLRLAKLMTGECDSIAYPSQAEITYVEGRDDIVLEQATGLNVGFWAFNTSKAPFDNVLVREALASAIDKTTIIDAVYFDSATRSRSLIPPTSWAFSVDTPETEYNPVRARELLAQAGYRNGFSMTLWALPVVRSYNPDALRMAELIRGYLAEVGITVEIVTSEWDSFRAGLDRGEHDSVLIGWSADNDDPDNFYRPLLSCGGIQSGTNRAMFCDAQYDAIIQQALLTTNIEQRKALYFQANLLIAEQIPLIPIAHANRYKVFRNHLRGVVINPYGGMRFGEMYKAASEGAQ